MKIPLFRNGGEGSVPTGARTQLDRERRPVANFSAISNEMARLADASKGPRLTDELAAPDLALAGLGRDISRAGSILEGVAIKREQAITDYQVAQADSQMQEAIAEQRNWQVNNPDPAGWDQRWSAKLQELEGALTSGDNLSNRTINAVNLRLERFKGTSAASISLDATKQAFNLAASVGKASVMRAIESQDQAAFEAEVSRMEAQGYAYPHEAEGMRQAFQRQGERMERQAEQEQYLSDKDAFATMLEADPWGAAEAVEDEYLLGSFDAAQRRAAKAEAEREIRKQQSLTVESIRSGVIAGDMGEKEIDGLASMYRLNAETVEDLKEFREQVLEKQANSGPLDVGSAIKLEAAIDEFNPDNMSEEDAVNAWGELHRRIPLEAAGKGSQGSQTRGVLKQKLYGKHPFAERRPDTGDFGNLGKNLEQLMRLDESAGNFGELEDEDGNVNVEVGQRMIQQKEQLRLELERAWKANPKQFDMPGSLQDWYNSKMGASKAGTAVQSYFGSKPSAALFPNPEDPERKTPELDPLTRSLLQFEKN